MKMCGECNFPGVEFGGSSKFVGQPGAFFQKVTAHDSSGNEIDEPKCEKCGSYKSQLIAKESFAWICQGFANPEQHKLISIPLPGSGEPIISEDWIVNLREEKYDPSN